MRRNNKIARLRKNMAKGVTVSDTSLRKKTNKGTSSVKESDIRELVVTGELLECGAIQITTKGRWISLNAALGNQHWVKSVGIKAIVEEKVREAIAGINVKIEKYFISIQYNSRMDDHNTVLMPKYYTDAIKKQYATNKNRRLIVDKNGDKIVVYEGVIIDDDKRYSKGTFLYPNSELPHNTYIITYYPFGYIGNYFQEMAANPIFNG